MDTGTGRLRPLAGRGSELRVVRDMLADAADGRPGVLLVHGEAGVGKTHLVARAVADAEETHLVLRGRCLRFGATVSPYLPLVTALDSWLAGRPDTFVADLADRVPALRRLVPDVAGAGSTGPPPPGTGGLLAAWEHVLAALAASTPTVVVIDDVQWADASSLDVLTYLASGLRGHRLCLLLTARDEELGEGHPLRAWLADLRRLPTTVDLALARLTQGDTREQLQALLGADPRPELVEAVWSRSRGNPYLTELLVRGLHPDAVALPAALPEALRDAVAAGWHQLSPPSRRLVQVLAVAGRPATTEQLAAVAHLVTGSDGEVRDRIREATGAGVVVVEPDGRVWLRHPLLAEVLYSTLLPEERCAVHGAYADTADLGRIGTPDNAGAHGQHSLLTVRHADQAVHCERAGRYDDAFGHCLAAAEHAGAVPAVRERAVLLDRAVELWPRVSAGARAQRGTEVDVVTAAATARRWAGDDAAAVRLLERARGLLEPDTAPLTAARVLTLAAETAYSAHLADDWPVDSLTNALALTEPFPDTPEHARVLADLAQAAAWRGRPGAARALADRALAAANRAGDPATTCWVYFARSLAYFGLPAGLEAAEAARRHAVASGQPEYVAIAELAASNAYESQGRIVDSAAVLAEGYRAAQRMGVGGMTSYLGSNAALTLLAVGDLRRAEQLLREVLATRPVGLPGSVAHLGAMVAAVRRDDLAAAERHLHATRELVPRFEEFPGLHGPTALAEYLLAAGRPEEALAMLHSTLAAQAGAEPRYGDQMLAWGARAAADLAAQAGDDPRAVRRAREAHAALYAERTRSGTPPFADLADDPTQRATDAVHRAETARLAASARAAERWEEAADAAAAAGLRYLQLEATARLADTHVRHGHRRLATGPLRAAHRLARELDARAVLRELEELALAARVDLAEPVVAADGPQVPAPALAGLTPREREVLAHLVAGRSYAEMAEELFISQKTVGVHVSNLLRKTGTANRVALAAWARRTSPAPVGDGSAHGSRGARQGGPQPPPA